MTASRIFRVPTAIGLVSAAGLLSALIGDGAFDALSWAALGLPVALIGWHWTR
ncbi:hypothetical protein [Oleomonas cavernae]|uniref:hypothetical protein n=1 Tax=Oleomonas cavernae TaxID=2320859 RepID=UPI0018F6F361|nr:hypothetical protein [Oleomonas cavernae]